MRKAVEEYLKGCGCHVERPSTEPEPITFENLVDGFLVHVLRLDSESYRRAFWREAYQNGHTIGHVPRTFEAFFRRNARTFEQKVSLFLALTALFGAYTALTLLVKSLSLLIRRLRRPTYYEREDLECFVDNTLLLDEQGRIVGRKGGIKRLLQREAPDLFEKYSTIMRYKAMAKRFRQACGTGEPTPPATLLPVQEDVDVADDMWAGLAHAREVAREILGECEGTIISLEAALALRLDPDCIPAQGEEYVRKPGRPRIPKKVIGWLIRRQVA